MKIGCLISKLNQLDKNLEISLHDLEFNVKYEIDDIEIVNNKLEILISQL